MKKNGFVFILLGLSLPVFSQPLPSKNKNAAPPAVKKITTYSTVNKTSKYTECFTNYQRIADTLLGSRLGHLLYTKEGLQKALRAENDSFMDDEIGYDTSLNIPTPVLQAQDKLYLEKTVTDIINRVYSITVKEEFPELKTKAKPFKGAVGGTGLNMNQPLTTNWKLYLPADVFKNIYKRSLIDVFIEIDNTSDDGLGFMMEDASFSTPVEFLLKIKNINIPPCLPVLRKKEFLYFLGSRKFFVPSLTNDDWQELTGLKEDIKASEDFTSFPLVYDPLYDDERFDLFFGKLNPKSLPADFLAVLNKVKKTPKLTEELLEDKYMPWAEDYGYKLVLFNRLSLEILKYLVFCIAHECYHAWFAYGKPGKSHEFNADAFATYMYLKIFTDQKLIHTYTKQLNSLENAVFGVAQKPRNDEDAEEDPGYAEMMKPFIGRSVTDIFSSLLSTTSFYEQQNDSHPAFSERISKIDSIIKGSLETDSVLQALRDQLVTIFNNQ